MSAMARPASSTPSTSTRTTGAGLGRALLVEATRGLADVGYHTAVLWVATGNERARRLYESEGWTAESLSRDAEILGVIVNEVRYRKRLDA
jgi:ribosomal protein S18 acetylase RimI-like enzyme